MQPADDLACSATSVRRLAILSRMARQSPYLTGSVRTRLRIRILRAILNPVLIYSTTKLPIPMSHHCVSVPDSTTHANKLYPP